MKSVSVEVKKTQHKYVIGPKGNNLSEIFTETGVYVEVPSLESTSETITLRGDADKLGPALTLVYAKVNTRITWVSQNFSHTLHEDSMSNWKKYTETN